MQKRQSTRPGAIQRAVRRHVIEAFESRLLLAANAIVAENQLPGSPQSEWDVAGAGDPTLQGYATDISVNLGASVDFKIDDRAAAPYHIDVYRMGYYGGMGARKVATISAGQTARTAQPAPLTDPATGLIDCGNWSVSASWQVPAQATSGIYFAKLVRDDTGGASHVFFVVRNDGSHSDLLFQTSDSTWEAYNTYGGNSVYSEDGDTTERAFKVSYNRPLVVRGTTGGLGDYNSPFHAEYPMVRWLERNGYDLTYFTDVDTDRRGADLLNHKVFLSVGHDEYWSGQQRANVEAARDHGINLAFFSGNEIYWKTRWENSIDASGTPYRTLVTYKESKANAKIDPEPVWTGTWRDDRFSPPFDGGRPENALSGTAYMNDRTNVDIGIAMQVPAADGKLRFWRNTSVSQLVAGQVATVGDRVVGYETDEDLDNGFRPAGLIDMSSTSFVTNTHVNVPWGSSVGPGSSTHKITLYRAPSGALVFGAGTIQWSWGLDGQHIDGVGTPDASMQQATVNLFADMNAQPTTLQAGLVETAASTDTQGPTISITSPAPGANLAAGTPVTVSGAASDVGAGVVGGVEVSVDGGRTWHPATGRDNWTYTWNPGRSGPTTVLARATDDSGNTGGAGSRSVSVFYQPTSTTGLVAAYDFNAGSGSNLADVSGHGNAGVLSSATWSGAGRYGSALSFNGVSSIVTVPDSDSLDLTTGMTLEAWVKPAALNGWESVLMKERAGGLMYALYASDDPTHYPNAYVHTASDVAVVQPISLDVGQWTHLASTFDGTTERLFVNGREVASQSANGTMTASTGALRIGGDTVFGGEFFQGLIDDVRIYNRALSAGEIGSDLSTPLGGSIDAVAPAVSVSGPSAGSSVSGATTLAATASDNIALAGVQFLLNGVPVGPEVTSAPYAFSWDSTAAANGAYTLTAAARDVAGNLTTSSGIPLTVNNPADAVPPTVTLTDPSDGAAVAGTIVLNATAADNRAVAGVRFQVNGVNIGPEVTSAPYRASWNTSSLATGTYTLTAVARDAAGNVTTSNGVRVSVDNSPPQVVTRSPAAGASAVPTSSTIVAGFSKPVVPGTISISVVDSANATVPGRVTYFAPTNTATFTPDATLAPSASYTVTVSGATDKGGLAMAGPVSWTFTATSQVTGATIWRNDLPAVGSTNDANAVELGVKFRSDVPGTITGIRFYQGAGNTGTHVGHLWTSDGTLLGTATFAGETGSGWQQANFGAPITISPDTTYIASYYAPNGHYAADNTYFASQGKDNIPLHALVNGVDGSNGVFLYAAGGGFPASTTRGANYWVDVVFDASSDSVAPAVVSVSPPAGATGVSTAAPITALFSEPIQSGTLSMVLTDAAGNAVPGSISYSPSTHQAKFIPTTWLTPSTTYTVSVSGARDFSGNPMAAPAGWSFATSASATYSLWRSTNAPTLPSASDTRAIEVGLKFKSDVNGIATGVSFYKGAGNTGTHVGSLWTAAGQLLGSVTFTDETASGWQEALFAQPIAVTAGNTYVVSYTAPNGHYAADGTYFASAGVDSGPLHAPSTGAAGGNGVFAYGGGFPTSTYNATNYWVDVILQSDGTIPVDTTAPTVIAHAPVSGATAVSTATAITATFSESIQPGTLSFTLTDPAGATVAATATYNDTTHVATLTPAAPLTASTGYVAAVSGAKDLAGNTMAAATWSFTTAAAAASYSFWTDSNVPATPAASDAKAVEVGMKFRSDVDGTITGVRFYKGTGNTGTHVGHLWSSSGALLASVTFSGETTTGWQSATFSNPVPVSAGVTYVVSYYAPVGRYAASGAYFASTGVDNGPIHAPANAAAGGNGVYSYGAGGLFPATTYNATNYWVDVVFRPGSGTQSGPPPPWQQTSVADFTAGTLTGGAIANAAGGEVQLVPALNDDFNGSALGSAWSTTSWTPSGGATTNVTVAGGILSVAGAEVRSTQAVPAGATFAATATFAAAANQHVGLATDFAVTSGNYWAIFSTGTSTNTLFARVNTNGTVQTVNLGALPIGAHQYRVQQVAGAFQFYVDGVLRTTISATFPPAASLRGAVSSFGAAPLQVDSIRVTSTAATFISSVFDPGKTATWGTANWTATVPPGTSLVIETSSGNTFTPDGSWSAWAPVAAGGTITSPPARYLRYRVTLTGDTAQGLTPIFWDITILWT